MVELLSNPRSGVASPGIDAAPMKLTDPRSLVPPPMASFYCVFLVKVVAVVIFVLATQRKNASPARSNPNL